VKNVNQTDNNKKGDSVMETTTFRYDCTSDASHIVKQEVHLIAGHYFLISKIDKPETMVFQCTEAGNVLNWSEEYAVYEDVDIAETVNRFQAVLWRHDLKEISRFKAALWRHDRLKKSDELKAEANACNERFRQTDGE